MLKKFSVLLFAILLTIGSGRDGYNAYAAQALFSPTISAANLSAPTQCAESDNVNIPISGNLQYFIIEATHPIYAVGTDNCKQNFDNCPKPVPGYPSQLLPGEFKLFDNGETVIEAVRENQWWLPTGGMTASVDNGSPLAEIHYIRVYRKIADAPEWPQFFVLYADSNVRLIPHPPKGITSVCFGSSVLVGPAPFAPNSRPFAEIASVHYVSKSKTLEVTYRSLGSASFDLNNVNPTRAVVKVNVNYPTNVPFTTFRSMFVKEGNADVDHVSDDPVITFPGGESTRWFFHRAVRSIHNTSAPDISIATLLPVYRFNNGAYHFYTISESEKDHIVQNMPGWKLEGIAYLTYAASYPDALPVYRFNTGTYHFYTISEEEKNNILRDYPQWKLEGIAYYADSFSGRAPYPVYRFNTGTYHFYTISEEEKNNILVNFPSWVLEGIAFYAYLQ